MKKRKIKKGIMLLSMVMIIISTILPVTSSATEYTTGDVLYEIINGETSEGEEIYSYIRTHINETNYNNLRFITVNLTNESETETIIRGGTYTNRVNLYTSDENYPFVRIYETGNTEYHTASEETPLTPYKITIYEIIELVPTPEPTPTQPPTPSPTPDERIVNLIDETGNGIGTILTWVGNLWEGITNGEMSAILPIFAIFVIIPIILLVIKIIRKSTWGD